MIINTSKKIDISDKELDKLCKYKLSKNIPDFQEKLKSSLTKFISYTKNNKKINGVCIIKQTKYSTEILYLCSNQKGLGTIIIKEVEKFSIKRGRLRINLESHPDAVDFYKKKGFKSVSRYAPETMTKELIKGKGSVSKISKVCCTP